MAGDASSDTSLSSDATLLETAENDNEVIDMLDPKMAKNVRFADIITDDDSDMDGGVMNLTTQGVLLCLLTLTMIWLMETVLR